MVLSRRISQDYYAGAGLWQTPRRSERRSNVVEGHVMECITWFAPILPGKLDEWKSLIEEIHGPREADHRRSRERMGLTREVVSHMQTPQGDFACLFHEGDDLTKSFQTVANSDDPHDQWFREKIQAIHGITADMLQGPLPASLRFDYKAG